MAVGQPTWRRGFDRIERAVGEPLEEAVGSRRYVDAVVLGIKVQVALNRKVRRTVDRQIGAIWHLLNLSTRADARRLSRQLAELTGEIRTLAQDADELSAQVRRNDSDPPPIEVQSAQHGGRRNLPRSNGGNGA